jgi:hypothetical protein
MRENNVKEINFKPMKEKVIIDGTDYSKSELNVGREELDKSKYVNSHYEFKVKSKHVQYLKEYVNSIEKFYHEEFDVSDKISYRQCEIHFPTPEQNPRLYKIIFGIFNQINNQYYKYDLDNSLEIQIVKYNPGGNYNWHCDYGLSSNPNADRKLSMSIQLSEKNEYEGCDLIICDQSRQYHTLKKEMGCGMVFDSKSPHKVTPLIKGVRYCLVSWMHGPRLR